MPAERKVAEISGLYAIIDASYVRPDEVEGPATSMLEAGVRLMQLRAKDAGSGEMLRAARALRRLTAKYGAVFIVNDRVDIAMLSEADGVHLGQDDIPAKEARELLGDGRIIGVSTHDELEAGAARDCGADYISFGPIFPTRTKKDASAPKGLAALSDIRKAVPLPIVAIGGITEDNMEGVMGAGADSVAMISEILLSGDIRVKAGALVKRMADLKLRG